jgi:hypothetical protein
LQLGVSNAPGGKVVIPCSGFFTSDADEGPLDQFVFAHA